MHTMEQCLGEPGELPHSLCVIGVAKLSGQHNLIFSECRLHFNVRSSPPSSQRSSCLCSHSKLLRMSVEAKKAQ